MSGETASERRDRMRASAEDYPGIDRDDLDAARAALETLVAAAAKCGAAFARLQVLDRWQSGAVSDDGVLLSHGRLLPADCVIADMADEIRAAAVARLIKDYRQELEE